MINSEATRTQQVRKKQWTLMFFFASDNLLSPSMLTQIKAIKAAGYQQDTNVLLHFDPNEKGVPTRIFEVNRMYSQRNSPSRIGGTDAPLVSVLASDDITPVAIKGLNAEQIDEMEAKQALKKFLDICAAQYPADHYMLFLVGHGMVVGRDAFLPDDNPISAIGLKDLGEILKGFSDQIKTHGGILQLLGMHSCSMSGVEVTYQLQGIASYMMASQGISFVGAWPYRQLLITVFNTVEEARAKNEKVDVLRLVQRLHDLCIQHSADFMVGGYSADLCLCTLNSTNVGNLDGPIRSLGKALKDGVADDRCRDLILLAHWKSQSYWQETYTDLYDFCLCLHRLCVKHDARRPPLQALNPPRQPRRHDLKQKAIEDACRSVMDILEPGQGTQQDGPVIRTDFIGAGSQYSHGLSIYFPWSEPAEDRSERALTNYENYRFSNFATSAWLEFLESYFSETKRPDRLSEDRDFKDQDVSYQNDQRFKQALDAAQAAFRIPGTQGGSDSVPLALDQKINPPDAGGGGCLCPSIKNYSKKFLMSPGASAVFEPRAA